MDHLPATSPVPDMGLNFQSGFVKCVEEMFASEFMSLPFLFPPSQQTLKDNLIAADKGVDVTARHERIKGIFCRCSFVLLITYSMCFYVTVVSMNGGGGQPTKLNLTIGVCEVQSIMPSDVINIVLSVYRYIYCGISI
ncbi:hypothetical protein DPMN_060487 [Dreissena polymorpha]|uniref:Uncharacterized protein n=1 Tax=Dreissena polymorpha TaxID=45954 RepID=A0A9D4HG27_DREPO|nr:hypothetical protein DPMN_060487 [Dreissena polymorpha]